MIHCELLPWERGQVLKLFRPGYPGPALEAELRQARTAHALGIPTPRAEGIIEIERDGLRRGIVFERCEGPTLLESALAAGAPVARLAQVLFDLQRSIHRCGGGALPELKLRLADKIRAARRASEAMRRRALEELARLPSGFAVCHGDLHPGNVIMSAKGPMVVDWVDAGRGDATLDLARTLLLLEHGAPARAAPQARKVFAAAYAQCLEQAWPAGPEPIARWRLPVAVARLAEPVDESECNSLLDHISTTLNASRS